MSFQKTAGLFGPSSIPSLLWMMTKYAWSPTYRQQVYEDRAEFFISGAYETAARLEKFGHSDPTISALIDEIMNFKEDPKYANYSPENYAYVQDISIRFLKATQVYNQKQPEQHIERVRDKVAKLYGHQSLDDDVVKDTSVWKRISDVNVEKRKEHGVGKGLDVVNKVLEYEARVDAHQLTIQAVKQVEEEGLLDRMKLFPSGGNHETVSRDVEAFDRLLYAEWESGLKPMNDKEKRIEFREFLEHRQRTWGEEYMRWLKTR